MIASNFLHKVYYEGVPFMMSHIIVTSQVIPFFKHGITNEMVEIQQKVKT